MSFLNFSRDLIKPLTMIAVLGTLGACTMFGDDDDQQDIVLCPQVAILGDAERTTQFKPGAGRDLIDVMFEAEIRNIRTSCKFLEGRVISEVAFELIASRGPAAKSGEGNFTYFVAVTDNTGRVLAKEIFDTRIAFTANRRRAGVEELTEQNIPIIGDAKPNSLEILVGFQLSEDQLKYNRRK